MTIVADAPARTRVPIGVAVPSLVRWGLSSDADLVFRTLATLGPRTRRTLTAELGLPVRRTDAALAELRECGAAVSTDDGRTTTRIWTARRPADVVSHLRSRRMRLVDAQLLTRSHHDVIRSLRGTASALDLPCDALPGTAGLFSDGLRYLPTRAIARQRLDELFNPDIREFLTISPEQAIDPGSVQAATPIDLALYQGDRQVRVLGVPPADGDTLDVSGHLLNGTSFQRREAMDVPLKLLMIDRRISFIPADPANLERGYVEVSRPAVMDGLIRLFDRYWSTATAADHNAVPLIRLTARESSLIALLAAGHTDHTAAERLRISPRSVTGAMRTLMDRLGVDNRFQLGLALGALRVATPPSLDPLVQPSPAVDQEN